MNLGLSTRRQNPAIGKPLTAVPELLSVRTFSVLAVCLGALVFAVYSPSLKFQFVIDDQIHAGSADVTAVGVNVGFRRGGATGKRQRDRQREEEFWFHS